MFVDQLQQFHRQLAIFYLRGGIKVTHGSTFHYRVFQHPSTLYSNFLTFPKLCVKCLVFASQLACHFWQWHHVNFAGSLRIRQYSWKFCNGTTIFLSFHHTGPPGILRVEYRGNQLFQCRIATGPKIILKYTNTGPCISTSLYAKIP